MVRRPKPEPPAAKPAPAKKWDRQTRWTKSVVLVEMQNGLKRTLKTEVASVNGKEEKCYLRVWEDNPRTGYHVATKDGITLSWDNLQELLPVLEEAVDVLANKPSPKK